MAIRLRQTPIGSSRPPARRRRTAGADPAATARSARARGRLQGDRSHGAFDRRHRWRCDIDIPAHGTALGKAVLAFHADARGALPTDVPLRRLTGRTLIDVAALDEALADVRASGIARAEDEAVIGESEVAAPIFDAKGAVAGAIAIVVPTSDLPVDANVEDAVRRAAIDVSRDLGAPTWPVGLPDQRAV